MCSVGASPVLYWLHSLMLAYLHMLLISRSGGHILNRAGSYYLCVINKCFIKIWRKHLGNEIIEVCFWNFIQANPVTSPNQNGCHTDQVITLIALSQLPLMFVRHHAGRHLIWWDLGMCDWILCCCFFLCRSGQTRMTCLWGGRRSCLELSEYTTQTSW